MLEKFTGVKFGKDTLAVIDQANAIISDYLAQGYCLTLRQLYYQFVARGLRENSERSYKNLGEVISKGRLAGLVSWSAIEDRGRGMVTLPHWSSPNDLLRAAAEQYRTDKWFGQPNKVIVMVEKQALEGVLLPVCQELDVPFCANKGYSSSTALYDLGSSLRHCSARPVVLYLGDHDPSGIDMTRDVEDRLLLFSKRHNLIVDRLALNYDQVEALNVPENPTKLTDSRAAAYVEQHGYSSWELDAISPSALARLVREAIVSYRDEDLWLEAVQREAEQRAKMQELADNYEF